MRNVNICFQDGIYEKIKGLVERRKISQFVNEAVEEKLHHEKQETLIRKQKEKEELEKEMIAGYQENVKNNKLQKELELWDRISGDGLSNE